MSHIAFKNKGRGHNVAIAVDEEEAEKENNKEENNNEDISATNDSAIVFYL